MKLVYAAITSLDGFVVDADGNFDWAAPDEEVHAFINDLERGIGLYLYGRRMYEVMSYWATPGPADDDPVTRDYRAVWQAADKIVFSSTLDEVTAPRTRLERAFDPSRVRQLKTEAGTDLSIGGPTLAAEALRAQLVDEVHLFLNPVVVGGGTPAIPPGLQCRLELIDQHRFSGGVVHLHYRVLA